MVKNLNTGVKLDFEHKVFFEENADMYVVVPKDISKVNLESTYSKLQKAEKLVGKEFTVMSFYWDTLLDSLTRGIRKEVIL